MHRVQAAGAPARAVQYAKTYSRPWNTKVVVQLRPGIKEPKVKRLFLVLGLTACSPGLRYTVDEANDIFKPKGNRDRNFTQGLQFSADKDEDGVNRRWHVRQIFYTPYNKRLRDPIPTERPYAGALTAGYTKTTYPKLNERVSSGFEYGIVGPYAFAEETQKGVHKLLGQLYPLGWDHQLKNEPILNYSYRRERTLNQWLVVGDGYDLGNMFTQTDTFFRLQSGDTGYLRPMWPRLDKRQDTPFRFTPFFEVRNRIVARNIFLDGNSFDSSRGVEKYPIVFEGSLGFNIEIRDISFRYTYTKMSEEYVTGDKASFGELQIRW